MSWRNKCRKACRILAWEGDSLVKPGNDREDESGE